MKRLLAGLLLSTAAIGQPSLAQAQNYSALVDALFSQMATTYVCRDALGGLAHYQAARTIALDTATQYIGRKDAVDLIAKMDEKFRNDPRVQHPNLAPQACQEMVNDGYFAIEKAKAALE